MKIVWFGHSSFKITTRDDISIVTDPYESGAFSGALNYKPIDTNADIITISHSHADHNFIQAVSGNPEVVRESGEYTIKGIKIIGLDTYHDKSKGRERGENVIFIFEADGLRIAHLGDLGCEPSPNIIDVLKGVDILMIPVGGTYTINAKEARDLIEKIAPRIVIPMHFKTDAVEFPIDKIDAFISEFGKDHIKNLNTSTYDTETDGFPEETQAIILKPLRM